MTFDASGVAQPGWYPDPSGAPGQRWWNGHQWTNDIHPPAYPIEATPVVRPGTPVYNVFIWLAVFVPPLAIIPIFFWDLSGYLEASMYSPTVSLLMIFDPAYLLTMVVGWLAYGLTVLFAFLDWRILRNDGYLRPFHWAWAFLYSVAYVIGRSVVVKRQAGRGSAPIWVSIALLAATVVAVFTWMTLVLVGFFGTIAGYVATY
ncbi:DUF2510 domain-containing protein [Luethyella okanaganae]|uniref:DUF2510 domain-containing protein n=1 Tax=Luethyella okanaganae TaxID=69372 RepID=A0ABW1VEY9_9MICO